MVISQVVSVTPAQHADQHEIGGSDVLTGEASFEVFPHTHTGLSTYHGIQLMADGTDDYIIYNFDMPSDFVSIIAVDVRYRMLLAQAANLCLSAWSESGGNGESENEHNNDDVDAVITPSNDMYLNTWTPIDMFSDTTRHDCCNLIIQRNDTNPADTHNGMMLIQSVQIRYNRG